MAGAALKSRLMDEATMQRTLTRIAHEVMEQGDTANLTLVGIRYLDEEHLAQESR